MSFRSTAATVTIAGALAIVTVAAVALAFLGANGSGTASAAVSKLPAPEITAATAAPDGTVALSWTPVSAPAAGTVRYYVTRNGKAPDGNCPASASPEAVTACTDSGLSPGSYEYVLTAVWGGWRAAGSPSTAQVTVGPASRFALDGSASTVNAGASVKLTITAQDEAGNTVTTFSGPHSLVFAGAAASPDGEQPTVSNNSGTAVAFGTPTTINFTQGAASVSGSKNGVLKLYGAGETNVTVSEEAISASTGLAITVKPRAASGLSLAAEAESVAAGDGDPLTITAIDVYGNTATSYSGFKSLTFSGAEPSPSGQAPSVTNRNGVAIAFGSATSLSFSAGVAGAAGGANGVMTLYASGATAVSAAQASHATASPLSVLVIAGPAGSLALEAASLTPLAGEGDDLTLTAKDAYENTATSYSGTKSLTFSGAEESPGGTAPSVVDSTGSAVPFGAATTLSFVEGASSAAGGRNGVMELTRAGATSVSASDGALTTSPLTFTVGAGPAARVAFSALTASAGTIGSPCLFTCTVSGAGNAGVVKAAVMITDEAGNAVSNLGPGKSVTVTASGNKGSRLSGSPLFLSESGPAVSVGEFMFTAPSGGVYSNTITAASSGYTSAKATVNR